LNIAPATEETGSIGFQLRLAQGLAFDDGMVGRPDLRLGRRAPPRVARIAPIFATYSVCTKSFENAGCAASAAAGASTSSQYEVTSISRVRLPELKIDRRRTSASSSGETITSSVVVIAASVRMNSARSSVKFTS
jgi:hypothetical protein